jgi:hypothetical protein
MGLVGQLVPIEADMAIVLYIGLVMTAQAFQATPSHHAPGWCWACCPAWPVGVRCCWRRCWFM